MTRTRKWTLGTALGVLLVLVAGWFLLISPKNSQAAELNAAAEAQVQQNVRARAEIAVLKSKAADLPAQQAKLAEIRQHLPQTPGLPALIRSLSDAASKSGVVLISMAPTSPAAVAAPAAPQGSTSGSTTTGTTAATTTATTTAALYQVPVTITVSGNYYEIEQFFNKVEGLTRSTLVTGFAFTSVDGPSDTGGPIKAAIQARVFYAPAAASVPPPAPAPAQPTQK